MFWLLGVQSKNFEQKNKYFRILFHKGCLIVLFYIIILGNKPKNFGQLQIKKSHLEVFSA